MNGSGLSDAQRLHQAGRLAEAIAVYEQLARANPNDANVCHFLGLALYQLGRGDDGVALMQRSVELQPNTAFFRSNLGGVLRERGETSLALENLEAALRLRPGDPAALNNLALVYRDRGEFKQAESRLRESLSINGSNLDAILNLSECLEKQEQFEPAFQALQEGLRHRPNDASILTSLGGLMGRKLKHDDAIQFLNQALQAKPNHMPALEWLVVAYIRRGYVTKAIEAGKRAIEAGSTNAEVYFAVANAYADLAEHAEAARWYEQGVQRENQAGKNSNAALLPSLYTIDDFKDRVQQLHSEWGCRAAEQAGKPTRPPVLKKAGKLKIGFVSGDFRVHSVAYFIEPLFQSFDDCEFELHAFSNTLRTDVTTDRLRQTKVIWHEIVKMSDDEAAQYIQAQEIDVLIDLSGHTSYNRLPVFARRPAAVQGTYLGYPATTGLAAIDFRITDSWADPVSLAMNEDYTERLARMDRCAWCYAPPESMPAIVTDSCNEIRLGCLNSFAKVTEKTLSMWGGVMAAIPRATLLLKSRAFVDEAARARVLERFERVGVDKSRLRFGSFVPEAQDHCSVFNEIDISLDPFPYHGTTTTCESLWMGVPVVTLAGQHHVSRVGVSLLAAVGLAEQCVASTEQEYVQKVVELVQDKGWREWFRQHARETMKQSQLMDCRGFADAFTSLVRQQYKETISNH